MVMPPVADLPNRPAKEKPILPLARKIVKTLYPARCLSCGEETGTESALCASCWPEAHFIAGSACACCGAPLLGKSEAGDRCETCHTWPPAWDQGCSVGLYDGPLRRMTLALKHGDRQDIARHMAKWMLTAGDSLITPQTLLVPVPLHWSRMLKRRFNQSVLIAQSMAKTRPLRLIPDALQRTRATKSQQGLKMDQRFENLCGAIRVHPKHATGIAGNPVLLIDDVMTTGATLSACADVCKAAGATSVNVLVFTRVARPE